MEQFGREFKRRGQFIARQPSMQGVELDAFELKMPDKYMPIADTPDGRDIITMKRWDRIVDFLQYVQTQLEEYGASKFKPMAQVLGYMRQLRGEVAIDGIMEYIQRRIVEAEKTGEKVKFAVAVENVNGDGGRPQSMLTAIESIPEKVVQEGPDGSEIEIFLPEAQMSKEALREIWYGNNEEWNETQDGNERWPSLFPNRIGAAERFKNMFGEANVAIVTGEVKPSARTQMVKEFQESKRKILLLGPAGKAGINAQDLEGTRIEFIHSDYPWLAQDTSQKRRQGKSNRASNNTKVYLSLFPDWFRW